MLDKSESFHLILDDPTGESFIESRFIDGIDHHLKVERYIPPEEQDYSNVTSSQSTNIQIGEENSIEISPNNQNENNWGAICYQCNGLLNTGDEYHNCWV